VYDPESRRVKTSRDVIFDEGRGWNWTTPVAGSSATASIDFDIEWPAEA
jgi:CRISPR/Cas system-associated exonuclease Cas4 (RecB family)